VALRARRGIRAVRVVDVVRRQHEVQKLRAIVSGAEPQLAVADEVALVVVEADDPAPRIPFGHGRNGSAVCAPNGGIAKLAVGNEGCASMAVDRRERRQQCELPHCERNFPFY
jgi:hypothetical protein